MGTCASSCIADGELCLSLYEGSKGTCCGGSSSCSRLDLAAGGYTCVNDATTLLALPKGNSVSAFMRAPKDNAVEDLQVAADLILLQVASRVPVKQQQLPFHLGCLSNADFIYRSL